MNDDEAFARIVETLRRNEPGRDLPMEIMTIVRVVRAVEQAEAAKLRDRLTETAEYANDLEREAAKLRGELEQERKLADEWNKAAQDALDAHDGDYPCCEGVRRLENVAHYLMAGWCPILGLVYPRRGPARDPG